MTVFGKVLVFVIFIFSVGSLGLSILTLVDNRNYLLEIDGDAKAQKQGLRQAVDEKLKLLERVRSELETALKEEAAGERSMFVEMTYPKNNDNIVTPTPAHAPVKNVKLEIASLLNGDKQKEGLEKESLEDLQKNRWVGLVTDRAKAAESLQKATQKNLEDQKVQTELSEQIARLQPQGNQKGLIKENDEAVLQALDRQEDLKPRLFEGQMKIEGVKKRFNQLELRREQLQQKGFLDLRAEK
jgi:hypothetical protein